MRLAPGWARFALAPLATGLILLALTPQLAWLGAVGLALVLLAGLIVLFFRDPDREIGEGIVAAADGRIRRVEPDGIVTFLNVHDVHVVRAPYAGQITDVHRSEGTRRPAFLDGADRNAGVTLELDTRWGSQTVRLLAGLVARQALAWVEPGDAVEKGDRIGMIRFGSRVDVTLPEGSEPAIEPGAKVQAGVTQIASAPELDDEEGPA